MTWQTIDLPWPADCGAIAAALSSSREIAWLDSGGLAPCGSDGGCSLLAFDPLAVITQHDQSRATARVGAVEHSGPDAWRLWRDTLRRMPRLPPAPCPLAPGWIGYIGFEMGRLLERIREPHCGSTPLPWMRMALFDRAIVCDPAKRRCIALCAPDLRSAVGLQPEPLEALVEEWNHAARRGARPSSSARTPACRYSPQAQFEQAVLRAKDHIAAGDVYQVNLAQRIAIRPIQDALAAYRTLRQANPARYGALLHFDAGEKAVASVSPELFLRMRGRDVLTSPIKGTRPRVGDPVLDAAAARELLDSGKDAAELAMIVDLHRNDLGRVCAWNSIRVENARRLETHPTVLHTVADIRGTLPPDRHALDLLMACFPAGSISGVPKIRAQEIIAALESHPRGVYTGAIGVLGLDGDLTLSVAIRTLQIAAGEGTLFSGGGIVAESDPADEYAETLAKARGILRGLQVDSATPRATAPSPGTPGAGRGEGALAAVRAPAGES